MPCSPVPAKARVPEVAGTAAYRPRRSVLYLPASNERALEKAKTLPVDALILDLEDAVAPDAKEQARENACAAARSGEYGRREVTIRVNGRGTQWHLDDLRAASEAGPDGIVVPKVGSAHEVEQLVAALEELDAPERTKLWAMVETPQAMLHCEEIAAASERLEVLVMGTNDLAKELRAEHVPGRAPLLTGLSLCLLAARATGKAIVDGVYNDDPQRNPDAVKYASLSFDEALERKLGVMDLTAICLCRDHNLPVRVFAMEKAGALLNIVVGGDEGTLIHA